MILAKAWNRWRAVFTREPPKAAPAPQPTTSTPLKAEGSSPAPGFGQSQPDVASPAPETGQTPTLGASGLLDAWKVRESALTQPPDLPIPDSSPLHESPDLPKSSAPSPGPSSMTRGDLRSLPRGFWFLVIAAATGLGGWLLLNTDPSDLPGREEPNAARSGPVEPGSVQLVMCPSEPVVPVAGDKDGRLPMQADVAGLTSVDSASFVILSNEAAAAGRARDAEVGLLMSCRIADKLKGAASVESADAKYRLGLHYADLSLHEGPAAALHRAEWLARAQILLADSLLTYSTRFGDNDDRSRLAANGLASVRQALAQKAPPEPVPSAPPVSRGGNGSAGVAKLPAPPQPDMAAKPPASPSPAIQARETTRPTPPAVKECPPAVATLGLCE